jgi:DNA-binding CsgD family transcriptional regulator
MFPDLQLRALATLAAFEAALNAIREPALVVDRAGHVLLTNQPGEALLACDRVRVQRALIEAARGDSPRLGWRLTPLRGAAEMAGYLAIHDGGSARRAVPDRWRLTARQAEILHLVATGLTNATIAETLGIKERTVEFHVSTIFDKAGVDNRATLLARFC